MADQRPAELTLHLEAASENNDRLILDALTELGDPAKRGKRKPTVALICEMTGLSRNTIRNRAWARKKLKELKQTLKNGAKSQPEDEPAPGRAEPTPVMLRGRITRILRQNALLYEQILQLQETLDRKDKEIATLKGRKNLSIVPPIGTNG